MTQPGRRGYPVATRARAIEMYESGMGAVAIGYALGVNDKTVYNWLDAVGVPRVTIPTNAHLQKAAAAISARRYAEALARRMEAATAPTMEPYLDGKTWPTRRAA